MQIRVFLGDVFWAKVKDQGLSYLRLAVPVRASLPVYAKDWEQSCPAPSCRTLAIHIIDMENDDSRWKEAHITERDIFIDSDGSLVWIP